FVFPGQFCVFLINLLSSFFFSYRRRHTISKRDWSSDVCSSDLSYGVILPSSLTRVRSLTLGCSPRLPVSVCGTGCLYLTRNFSWQCDVSSFGTIFPSSSQLVFNTKHFTLCQTHCLNTNPITCSA